jgi:hypothetical protein
MTYEGPKDKVKSTRLIYPHSSVALPTD